MSQSRFARAVGALAAFAVCPGVLAEEPQRIEEVVVTGAREATPLAATPAAIGRLESARSTTPRRRASTRSSTPSRACTWWTSATSSTA